MRSPRFVLLLASFLGAGLLVAGGLFWRRRSPPETPPVVSPQEHRRIASNVLHSVGADTVASVLRIEAEERQAAETFWAKEMLAQQSGAVVEKLWDAINAATNSGQRWEVIGNFLLAEVILGEWRSFEEIRHGIQAAKSSDAKVRLNTSEWKSFISATRKAGWELEQTEFR